MHVIYLSGWVEVPLSLKCNVISSIVTCLLCAHKMSLKQPDANLTKYTTYNNYRYTSQPPDLNQVGQRVPTRIEPTVKRKFLNSEKKGSEIVVHTTNSSSRYLDTAIWSPSPFLRRVFKTRSRANACPDAGSSGRSLILVSVGSPSFS